MPRRPPRARFPVVTAAPKRSPAVRLLEWQAALVLKRPRWFVWPQVLLAVLCVAYTAQNLKFSTSRNDLVDANKRYHSLFLEYRAEFGALDDLLAIVESENQEKNRQFIERLGARVRAETNLFQDVFFKGALPELGPKALLFLPTNTLAELRLRLERDRPLLEKFAGATNLNSLFLTVNRQFRAAQRETNGGNSALVGALPALERIVNQARDSLVRPGTPPSPGIDAFFGGGPEAEREVYVTFADGRLYLLTARPVSRAAEGDAIRRLRALVAETRLEVPGVNAGVTGGSVLEVDEMAQSQADSLLASAVSFVVVLLIFVYGYHETGRPLKAMLCLLVGLAYSMAWTTAVVGRLNILTITFAPMLIGMAVDFGVHLVTRYEEELRRGESVRESLRRAMVNTGLGIFTGALTTAAAFFAMAFTDFAGVREMGLITGGGLLACLVPMMTMLPALLMKGVQNRLDRGHEEGRVTARERVERFILRRPWVVLGAGATAVVLSLTQFPRVWFDYDLRNMQSAGLPAVEFEKKLLSATSTNAGARTKSLLFGAVMATNAAQALALEARLTNLATVADVESIARLLAEDDRDKLRQVNEIKAVLAPVRFAGPAEAPPDLRELRATLVYLQGYLGTAEQMVERENPDHELIPRLRSLNAALETLARQITAGDPARTAAKLGAFEDAFFSDLRDTFETLKRSDTRAALGVADLPPSIRNRFIGQTGRLLLQVYPRHDVWERGAQEAFVAEVRRVAPDVTGEPVQLYEYTGLLRSSYERAALYAMAAMVVMVFIQFRSPAAVLLAHLPVLLAGVWTVGLMGAFGVPFNPANIMTLPLVVGIGVTFGVHILTRFAEEKNPAILAKSTGKAVLVSGLTTVAGFGSLMLAKHQGIVGLGFVMSLGVAGCMVGALSVLPAVLVLQQRWRERRTRKP